MEIREVTPNPEYWKDVCTCGHTRFRHNGNKNLGQCSHSNCMCGNSHRFCGCKRFKQMDI